MPAALTFHCALPPDQLFAESVHIDEALSQVGRMDVNLLSPRQDIVAKDLLGKPVALCLAGEAGKRWFHGHVVRFGHGAARGRFHSYHVEVRPWPWFLSRTADCRIFQDMTVPEIVKKVCDDHPGIAQLQLKLMRSYRKRTYCVQYRESDLAFISRLLALEGIYWQVAHTQSKHTLVLMDAASAHDPLTGVAKVRHIEQPEHAAPDQEYLTQWRFDEAVQTEKVVLSSYDFERPSTSLLTDVKVGRSHAQAGAEVFDYQGDYLQVADGKQLAENMLDAQQSAYQRFAAAGNVLNLEAGRTFSLTGHPRDDQNAGYLLTRVVIDMQVAVFDTQALANDIQVQCEAIPQAQQFRPPVPTPKPVVQGPQTAVVVGPAGEEIFTDKYGRVKVHFHWDRLGKKDDKASCWVRVSQPWAGKNFGMIHTPRIGQEVVVSFLEGDPDQPLITGRVYNAEQMPPWELPANATQSGILTRSSKGGAYGNANAIRFEDKKGSEQLWIHAEKNQDIEVENDETHWVGHDRSKTVDHDEQVHVKHDRTEQVDHDESITIGNDRHLTVGHDKFEQVAQNKSVTVGVNHTETIGAAMSLTVGATLTESIAINHAENVGGAMELTVGGAMAITVGAAMAETVGGAKVEAIGAGKSATVGGNASTTIGGALSESVGKTRSLSVAEDDTSTVGGQAKLSVAKEYVVNAKKIQLVAEDELQLKVGSAEITLKENGDVVIKGGKVNVKGSGDVVIKGSKIAEN